MNDSELEKKLKAARVPERPEDYWERFPRRVLAAARAASTEPRLDRRPAPWLARGFGLGFACLLLGLAIGYWLHGRRESDAYVLPQNEKVLREMLALFPNRVRAIVQDEHGLRLVLSDQPDVPDSTPLWIKVCDGTRCQAMVTFSGQELQIAREKVVVLADAQGQIRLVGNRFLWSSAAPNRAAGHLRIQARPLAYTL